jgi:uncharacterized protein (DUF433 family)
MKQDEQVIHSDPEIMGGTPVFVGTRSRRYSITSREGTLCPSSWDQF